VLCCPGVHTKEGRKKGRRIAVHEWIAAGAAAREAAAAVAAAERMFSGERCQKKASSSLDFYFFVFCFL